MDERSDEELMASIARGDGQAFAVLARRHGARAAAVANRIVLNRSDAEEIVQEALTRVWVKAAGWRPPTGEGDASFATWFRRIVVNLAIDRVRRPVGEDLDAHPDLPAAGLDPEALAGRGEVEKRVRQAVAALPERQRAALVLCHFEEASNIEAAKTLGLSVGAVESLLVRARRTLKQNLADLS